MGKYILKFVEEADAAAISDIYTHYVRETPITFEVEPPSADEIRNRIRSTSADYPYIVCVSDGKIVGYAYAHRQKERAAYGWNAELSVYVDRAHQRGGIGKALYGALIDILRLQNVQNVYGGVTVPNLNSEKLHEHMGFVRLGTYHQTGYKLGKWHDVAHFEKAIGDHGADPKPFVPLKKLDRDEVRGILKRFSGFEGRGSI